MARKKKRPANRAHRFSNCVSIFFEDGSCAYFQYAHAVQRDKTLHVFTEHCGDHKFLAISIDDWQIKPYRRIFRETLRRCSNCRFWRAECNRLGECVDAAERARAVVPSAVYLDTTMMYGQGGKNCPCFEPKKGG